MTATNRHHREWAAGLENAAQTQWAQYNGKAMTDTSHEAVERLATQLEAWGCMWRVGDVMSEERAQAHDEAAATLRALQAKLDVATGALEKSTPWAKLGMAVMERWPDEFGDIDGVELQDMAEASGVLVAVPGGFDPDEHDGNGEAEPGDPWFFIVKRPDDTSSKEPT